MFNQLRYYPSIANSLHIDELSAFLSLASKFIKENNGAIHVDADNAPIDFLTKSLNQDVTPGTWEVLWKILFDDLKHCFFDANEAYSLHGLIKKENRKSLDIPQLVLFPPHKERCPNEKCNTYTKNLHRRPLVAAYLYDIDGIRSVHHYTMYCESTSTLSSQKNLKVAVDTAFFRLPIQLSPFV